MQARPAPTILAPITTAPEPCSAQLIPSDLGWSWNSLPIIAFSSFFSNTYGGPGRTRTCDLWFRKPLLYPAELRSLSASPRVAERSNQFASDVLNSRGSSVARNRAGADRSHKPGSRSHRPAVVDMARSHSPGKRSRILIGGRRSRNVDRHGRSRSRSCSHSRLAGNHSHRANGHNGCHGIRRPARSRLPGRRRRPRRPRPLHHHYRDGGGDGRNSHNIEHWPERRPAWPGPLFLQASRGASFRSSNEAKQRL